MCSHSLLSHYETISLENGVILMSNHRVNDIHYQHNKYTLEIEDQNSKTINL